MWQDKFTKEENEDLAKLVTAEAKRRFIALKISKNFDMLVHLLGYRDLGSFHKEQLDKISEVRKIEDVPVRRLWLWSRGFFKTSLINEAHSIFLIINNPNIRILVRSSTLGVAEDILRNIKNHFMTNEEFRYFFREFCPKASSNGKIEFGTVGDFTIPNRTRNLKESTMMASGRGTNLTGLHFDYMKLDDLVTKDSVTNETQIQESKDDYYSLRHLFDKAAVPREDVIGTIYHFNDLYSDFRRAKNFDESIIPAKINGEAVFKERLNEVQLSKLELDIGPYQYQSQYMLNPINPADAKFKEGWLREYEELPTGLSEYICVDPASTTKKKSDYTVIQRWGIDFEGRHYLLDGIRDKMTAFQRIDKLFEIAKRSKNLRWITYEVLGGRHGDLEVIDQRMRQEKVWFHVKQTKGSSASKEDRIEQRLVPAYHAGIIFLPKSSYFRSAYDGKIYDFCELLRLEYLQFPFTEHDDILDCQAQMFEEQLIIGKRITAEVKRTGKTADDIDREYKFIDRQMNKYRGVSPDIVKKFIFMNRMKRLVKAAK